MIIWGDIYSALFKDKDLDNKRILELKMIEVLSSFILEDFVQVGLQYYYFEKYAFMPLDLFAYINAGFMVFKALELTLRKSFNSVLVRWRSDIVSQSQYCFEVPV